MSLVRSVLQKLRRNRADQLEERDWRRRIILASRKIQHVHTELTDDIADVRGLKAHIEHARPEIERLEIALAESRGVFASLQEKIDEHSAALTRHVEAQTTHEVTTDTAGKAQELERLLVDKDILIRALQGNVAVLRQEMSDHQSAPKYVEDSQLEFLAQQKAEVELQERALQSVRLELEHALGNLEHERKDGAQRVADLEGQLRSAEEEQGALLGSHGTDTDALREELEVTKQGAAQLDSDLANLRDRNDELETQAQAAFLRDGEREKREEELESATGLFEVQIEEMTEILHEFQNSQDVIEKNHSQQEADSAARILELEGHNQDLERMRADANQVVAETETHAQRLREVSEGREEELALLRTEHARQLTELDCVRLEGEQQLDQLAQDHRAAKEQWQSESEELSETALAKAAEAFQARYEKLAQRLKVSEIARFDIETRHEREMMDFADHSRMAMDKIKADLSGREKDVHALLAENEVLEQRADNAERRASLINELQSEVRESSRDLEKRTARLLDLMSDDEDASGHLEELPELPAGAEPFLTDELEASPEDGSSH